MRKRLLALSVLLPLAGHGAAPAKLGYAAYSQEMDRLAAACETTNQSTFNGMCMSRPFGDATRTALNVAQELHRFEAFLVRCELPEPNGWAVAKTGAFKIADVQAFYGEMAPQTEAREVYSRYSNDCKSASENQAEANRRLQWLAQMTGKHTVEGREKAAQADRQARLQRSLAEKAQWETDPWFVGAYSGSFPLEKGTGSWALRCAMGEACVLTMTNPGAAAQTIPMRVPIRRETAIPNNNLMGTREAVRQRPELYQDPQEGPLLVPLRSLLASQARFERCVDIGDEADLALCSLTTDPRAAKSLVLLLGTMKGSCGDSPFCAYFYQVMTRE